MSTEREFLVRAYAFCAALPLEVCDGCDSCGLRCAEGTPMTRGEYVAIRRFLRSVPLARIARVEGEDKKVPLGDGIEAMACRFRDMSHGRCFVYAVRPLICRLFGLVEWLPCPIEKVPLAGEEAVALFQEYAGFERRTYEEWEAGEGR